MVKKQTNDKIGDVEELEKYLPRLEDYKLRIGENLVQELAFMRFGITKLKKEIIDSGFIDDYQNGENQHGKKQSASVQAYNQLMASYNKTIKTFIDLFNKNDKATVQDHLELNGFLGMAKAVRK